MTFMEKKSLPEKDIPKVVITIDIPWSYEREFLLGISRYCNHHGSWIIHLQVLSVHKTLSHSSTNIGDVDGIIAFSSNFRKNKKLFQSGIPTIAFTDGTEQFPNIPSIEGDEEAIGKLGAEHLIDRKFKNFAFCGYSGLNWSKRRYEGFHERVAKAGFKPNLYERRYQIKSQIQIMTTWLKSLPKPLGLMACDDEYVMDIMEVCKKAKIQIPMEVAVLGVDNDSLLCNLSYPPISSVAMASQKAGYEVAALLDKMMKGAEKTVNQKIVIRPSHVVTRLSTNVLAVEDTLVAEALQLIRENAHQRLQAEEVADMLAVSRQFLHKRFRKALGSTVHTEIKNTRNEQIANMLIETDLPIEKIALTLGYADANHLARYFKSVKGIAPSEYRKKYHNP
jgi:LacI family transcriptional regulator, galactose operon repressor